MGEFSVGHLFLMANGYLKSERGYRKLEISLSGNANISGVLLLTALLPRASNTLQLRTEASHFS